MRRIVFIIASVLVSGLFLWLALRGVDLQAILSRITQANPVWAFLALASMSLGLWTRAVRWRGLVNFKIPLVQAGHILNIGFLLNMLPLRAGEFVRMLLATRNNVPLMTAAASVVVERLIDTLLVVVALAIALTRVPNAPAAITTPATLFGVAVVAAFAVLIFFARYPIIGHKALEFVERLLPFLKRFGLRRLFDNVLDGLKPLTQWRSAAHAIGWTLISWAVSLFTFYALERALNIDQFVTANGGSIDLLLLAVLGLTLASFSIAVPVTVAGIGPFQAAVLLAGQTVGLSQEVSLSLGFLFHGTNIAGYAIWGTIGLLATGVSLGDVLTRARGEQAPEEAPSNA